MDNVLRMIETEDVVFYEDSRGYKDIEKEKFLAIFKEMEDDGILEGNFEDELWTGFSGVRRCLISFRYNEPAYVTHFMRLTGIPAPLFGDMLRCFALYLAGVYILKTIKERILLVSEFAGRIGDRDYSIQTDQEPAIVEFLLFAGIPEPNARDLLKLARQKNTKPGGQRELAPMVNYLAIADAINDLFGTQLSDEDFVKWCPIYFWVNVTFIIPLRATEMLVTPYNCFEYGSDGIRIRLRRTQLKKKSHKVGYKVEEDYKICSYRIPRTETVDIIERYRELTRGHEREYLFDYSRYSINEIFSLRCFNGLLADFTGLYLIGNHRYNFARYAAGIYEFVPVTAGDSRPIAMANLFFQDIGADVCRELADHMNISTSAGYYTNVSETIYATSIVDMQRRINVEREKTDIFEKSYGRELPSAVSDNGCFSPRRPRVTGDITDCISQDHLHECLGCRFYHPDRQQLDTALEQRRRRLDDASRMVFEQMADKDKIRARERDFDRIFLEAHTSSTRYRTACDSSAMEAAEKWHRKRDSQKTS